MFSLWYNWKNKLSTLSTEKRSSACTTSHNEGLDATEGHHALPLTTSPTPDIPISGREEQIVRLTAGVGQSGPSELALLGAISVKWPCPYPLTKELPFQRLNCPHVLIRHPLESGGC
ncbi:hypothetical protein J6590_069147 [Homalodisca vitripennis]|nr:hypothetical protein J6590_069147 [Homalodisca vitripennis]